MRISLILAISLTLLFSGQIFPQQTRGQQGETEPNKTDTDIFQFEKSNEQILSQRQFLEQALEKEINPDTYLLGPGDQLLIKVWGPMENQFVTEVTPEGYVVIPTITDINISGLTLAEGSKKIKETLNNYFKQAKFSIRLIKMRKFRIFVVGEIENPGTYYVRAADRVSEVIYLAGGLSQWGNDTQIELRHTDGNTDTLNLSQFLVSGDLTENPHLDGGDVVYVPPIDLERNYVILEGNVGSEGIYQIQPDETMYAFLTRTRAMNRKTNVNRIILTRDGKKQIYDLIAGENEARNERLQTGDRITVPTNRDRVYVKGEVMQPGPFPYMANYKARDYAGFAGLMDTAKGMESIYVIRVESGDIAKGGDVVVGKGDIVVVPKRTREVFKDYMSILTPIISIGISAYALIRTAN